MQVTMSWCSRRHAGREVASAPAEVVRGRGSIMVVSFFLMPRYRQRACSRGWEPRVAPGTPEPAFAGIDWLVGVPRMSAVARHLAADLDVRAGWRVGTLERREGCWRLVEADGERVH